MIKNNQTKSEKQPILDAVSGQVSNRLRFKILQTALAVHVLIISCPFVWNLFYRFFNPPKKKIINVRLITRLPTAPSESSSSMQGGAPTPPEVTPVMPKVAPRPRPKTLKPPPIKRILPPKIKPKAPPKVRPKPKPQPKPRPKPRPRPKPKAKPKTSTKKFVPISKDPRAVEAQTRVQNSQTTRRPTQTPQGPPGDNQEGEKFQLDYTQFVGQYLKANWEPPSILQLGGKTPEVTVRIWLSPSGHITQWRLLKSSGHTLVDNSVKNLFFRIRKLPHPPPKGVSDLTLVMEIKKD